MVLGQTSEESVLLGLFQFQQVQLFVVDTVLFSELLLDGRGILSIYIRYLHNISINIVIRLEKNYGIILFQNLQGTTRRNLNKKCNTYLAYAYFFK